MKIILPLLLVLASFNAYAFDDSNEGVYAVIHKDGHVTNKIFRVMKKENGWVLEDKLGDGSWKDVTCEHDCVLRVSSIKEVEYLMNKKPPQGMRAECLHNTAFGFCAVVFDHKVERYYLLIALVNNQKIPIQLKRLNDINH